MKNIFIAIIFVLIACVSAKQATPYKEDNKYKAYKEFNGDTVKYLTYNFIERKRDYQGKRLSVLLNDLEFKIKYSYLNVLSRDINNTNGLSVSFYEKEVDSEKRDNSPLYILEFEFQNLISWKVIDKIREEENNGWGEKHQKFFGEQMLKDVYLVVHPDPRLKKK